MALQFCSFNTLAQPATVEQMLVDFHNNYLGGTNYSEKIVYPRTLTQYQKQQISTLQCSEEVNNSIRVLRNKINSYNSESAEKYNNVLNKMVKRKVELDVYQQIIRENFNKEDLINALNREINNLVNIAGPQGTKEKGFIDEVRNYMLGQYSAFTYDYSDNYIDKLVKNEISMRNKMFKGREDEVIKEIRKTIEQIKSFRNNTTFKYGGEILQEDEKLVSYKSLLSYLSFSLEDNDVEPIVSNGCKEYLNRKLILSNGDAGLQLVEFQLLEPENIIRGYNEFIIECKILKDISIEGVPKLKMDDNTFYNFNTFSNYLKTLSVSVSCPSGTINLGEPKVLYQKYNSSLWQNVDGYNASVWYRNMVARKITYSAAILGIKLVSSKIGVAISTFELGRKLVDWINEDNNNLQKIWEMTHKDDFYSITSPEFLTEKDKITGYRIILPIEIHNLNNPIKFKIEDLTVKFNLSKQISNSNPLTDLNKYYKKEIYGIDDKQEYYLNNKIDNYTQSNLKKKIPEIKKTYYLKSKDNPIYSDTEKVKFKIKTQTSEWSGKNYFLIKLIPKIDWAGGEQIFHINTISLKLISRRGDIMVSGLPDCYSDSKHYEFINLEKQDAAMDLLNSSALFASSFSLGQLNMDNVSNFMDVAESTIGVWKDISQLSTDYYNAMYNTISQENNFDIFLLPSFQLNQDIKISDNNRIVTTIAIPVESYVNNPLTGFEIQLEGSMVALTKNQNRAFKLNQLVNTEEKELDEGKRKELIVWPPRYIRAFSNSENQEKRLYIDYITKSNFDFKIDVATESGCLGDIKGTASYSGKKATYRDQYIELQFLFTEESIIIEEKRLSEDYPYSGLRCGFAGTYGRPEEIKPKAKKNIDKIEITNKQNILQKYGMVKVTGGTFKMGSKDGCKDKKPIHNVTVSTFYISKYECTQQLWQEIMSSNPSYFKGSNNPVEEASWNDIQIFIKNLNQKTGMNFRLPTEAEWEFAARGGPAGLPTTYAGSNSLGSVGWYTKNSYDKGSNHPDCRPHPVGQKQPNELGLYDMSGNVYEWCADWYNSDYYSNSPQQNPRGPSSGTERVIRGGSWNSGAGVASRLSFWPGPRIGGDYKPGYGYLFIGFRLAHSLDY